MPDTTLPVRHPRHADVTLAGRPVRSSWTCVNNRDYKGLFEKEAAPLELIAQSDVDRFG